MTKEKYIPPEISDYIDSAIERERKIFNKDVAHYIEVTHEKFKHDLKAMTEQLPTRTEVREICREVIREEVPQIVRSEITKIVKPITSDHERRITRLEHKAA